MSLHDIAADAHRIAKERGFETPSWGNFYTKMAMVGTEILEAIEAMDSPERSPTTIGYELADICLRTLDILHCLTAPGATPGVEGWSEGRVVGRRVPGVPGGRVAAYMPAPGPFVTPETLFKPVWKHWRGAIEHTRRDERRDAILCLELLLLEVFRVADALRLPLLAHLELKNKANEQRPHLNGKKDPRA